MAIFLVAHGAWSAGWAWRKMHAPMRAAGHDLHTPTYTGLGERGHLANASIDLAVHIQDVLAVLEHEDLHDVVLLGHSYGGMVATGVADRAHARIAQLIYLDAFVPRDGQSLFDLQPAAMREAMRVRARASGDGWRIPPNPMPPDTPAADRAWAEPRRLPQPIQTFETPLRLTSHMPPPPRSYIYCRRCGPDDLFRQFADRARSEAGWRCFEIDASHNPHITAPEVLTALLDAIAAGAIGDASAAAT